MTNTSPSHSEHDHDHPLHESEILISRMVDAEATAEDRAQFDLLAGGDPSLWRRLAMRQHEMAVLSAKVESDTRFVDRINLPSKLPQSIGAGAGSRFRLIAYSGWAAMLLLATSWWVVSVNQADEQNQARQVITESAPTLSFDEHRVEYMKAPYVVGEMAPTMLHREVMSDGRTAIRFLRRVEEVLFLPAGQEPPTDQDGAFTSDPSRLRGDEAYRQPSN